MDLQSKLISKQVVTPANRNDLVTLEQLISYDEASLCGNLKKEGFSLPHKLMISIISGFPGPFSKVLRLTRGMEKIPFKHMTKFQTIFVVQPNR